MCWCVLSGVSASLYMCPAGALTATCSQQPSPYRTDSSHATTCAIVFVMPSGHTRADCEQTGKTCQSAESTPACQVSRNARRNMSLPRQLPAYRSSRCCAPARKRGSTLAHPAYHTSRPDTSPPLVSRHSLAFDARVRRVLRTASSPVATAGCHRLPRHFCLQPQHYHTNSSSLAFRACRSGGGRRRAAAGTAAATWPPGAAAAL